MKKVLAVILAAVFSLGVLNGCQSGESGAVKDTATFISMVRSESFDPTSGALVDKTVMHSIFDTLLAFAPDGEIIPMLAESWEESEDKMSVTFKLREDVKFHNGDPLTADDVIYTFDAMFASTSLYYMRDTIASYEKIDDYTVRFTKAGYYTRFLETMVEFSYIMPKDYHTAQGVEGFEAAPIGTGPYKVVSQEVDDSVILVANEDYYGDPPGFKNMIIKPPLDPATGVIALETGEADIIPVLPPAQATLVEANDNLTLVTELDNWSTHIILMMMEPMRSDTNLRKAIFHGINRENAIQLGNEGIGEPSKNLFGKRIMGDFAGAIDFVGYDEEMAKEYLANSDYNGEPLTLTIYANTALAESIQSDLRKIGINIEIELLDTTSFVSKMEGATHMAMAEFGTDSMSIEDFLFMFGEDSTFYGAHMARNAEYEELLDQLQAPSLPENHKELVIRGMEIIYEIATMVPVYDASFNYAYGPNVVYDYKISAPTYVFYPAKIMPAEAQ